MWASMKQSKVETSLRIAEGVCFSDVFMRRKIERESASVVVDFQSPLARGGMRSRIIRSLTFARTEVRDEKADRVVYIWGSEYGGGTEGLAGVLDDSGRGTDVSLVMNVG